MPNLKHIKVRIKSIKSTQKITQAMKLVAASKVRRAQIRVLNSRPYTQQIINFIHKAVVSISSLDKNEIPLMRERLVKSVGIIVISSDRGLCGSYNTNILKKAMRRIIELEKSGVKLKLITIGNKANNFFKRTRVEILDNFTQLPAIPNIELANLIAGSAENAFLNKTVDQVEIIGTDFISMLRNEVYTKQFLPIIPDTSSGNKQPSEILFEPTLDMVLGSLLPLYLSNIIYHALLEASCSELASRMNAMSNATKNAKELIDKLTIVYNKARQAAITQELSEIVGGVEALK
ncbi:MAG: ATP synthase F1 subunit gamma [Candidatus Melainabacteria bacterium RIFCSPLOWO2_02_FULL_35_15]|nr:MAG: ATP synthase F1 subunit gamma [Candidatus Melainabacteria bacterium RIFCSPLOWO2_12_FULL_35_11]OGI13272.1 MAG: ATP synthase F1 subunit gamma [Candidatus Melainabacteria bacterium RIFCSPLOWO2_02_FULL_35_15]